MTERGACRLANQPRGTQRYRAIRREDEDTLTGALLGRITHHVHLLEMNGDSYRLKQSCRKRNPPNNTDPSNALQGRRASSATLQSPFSPENNSILILINYRSPFTPPGGFLLPPPLTTSIHQRTTHHLPLFSR